MDNKKETNAEPALIEAENEAENAAVPKRVYKFYKPVDFEGVTYTQIDLDGLDRMTGKDLKELDRMYMMRGGTRMTTKEMTPDYLFLVASRASGMPIEFFDCLGFKDAGKLEVVLRNFIMV